MRGNAGKLRSSIEGTLEVHVGVELDGTPRVLVSLRPRADARAGELVAHALDPDEVDDMIAGLREALRFIAERGDDGTPPS